MKVFDQLTQCVRNGDGHSALDIIHTLKQEGYVPSVQTYIMAIDASVTGGTLNVADEAFQTLQHQKQSSQQHEDEEYENHINVNSARNILAVAYTSKAAYDKAASIMNLPSDYRTSTLPINTKNLNLGKDSVAWGILVKIFTKTGMPEKAVTIVDEAMQSGVGMTDSLLHLTIDALRMCGKWKEALWIFERAVEKGIHQPHERTLASMLLALSSKRARKVVDVNQVIKVIDMADNPSLKFLSVALMATSSVGAMATAENIFSDISALCFNNDFDGDGVPGEIAFSCMMATYVNFLEKSVDNENDIRREKLYEEVNSKADNLWNTYLKCYRLVRPTGMTRIERDGMLGKYLRTKTRCFRIEESVKILEEISSMSNNRNPWHDIKIFHITAVMGAVELACDANLLKRLLSIMNTLNIQHDMRSLGFSVGTFVGDGDLKSGLELVRNEIGKVMISGSNGDVVVENRGKQYHHRQYYPALLLRRLQMLSNGFRDIGIGKINDLQQAIDDLQMERVHANLSSSRLDAVNRRNGGQDLNLAEEMRSINK